MYVACRGSAQRRPSGNARIPYFMIPQCTPKADMHLERHSFGEGNGSPLQGSCLENPGDGEPGGLPSVGSHSRTRLKQLSSSICQVEF